MSSLGGIFNNGVSGLMAFTEAMGAVTDNIANMNSVGYKRVETQFSSMLGESYIPGRGNGPAANSNINGVSAKTHQLISLQGTVQTTNRTLDVAINGQGMYAFTDDPNNASGNIFYGRAGNFQMVIPPGGTGTSAYLANARGQYLLASPITGGTAGTAGTATLPTGTTQLVPVQVTQTAFAGQPTQTAALTAVIPAAGATTATAPVNYIDALGVSQGLTLTWTNPVAVSGTSTTWNVTATDANGAAAGASTITFNNLGQAIAPATIAVTATSTSVTPPAAPSVNSFTIDLAKVAMLGNAAAASNGAALAQVVNYAHNGLPAGNFEQLSIGSDGVITNRYSGGATAAVYQIPLAVFTGVNSLESRSGDVFVQTQASGAPSFVFPGNTFASLKAGAVETANVDLADSFSQMIITQRAYQTAAQVVKVADEMTTVATQLKR
jgi:flagellar hook protein FlgE